jgi:hypothetical protein
VAGLDCDALALLVVRLESDRPAGGDLCWHRWDQSLGAEPHGLDLDAARSAHRTEPFKHIPEPGATYFSAHVERLLFPPENAEGARLLCCPDDLFLDLGIGDGSPRQARVELLERITTPVQPGATFGLIHLTLLPTDDPEAPDSLWWASAIRSKFRRRDNPTRFALRREGNEEVIDGGRPIRALAERLFHDPHQDLERSMYAVLMARCPDDCRDDPAAQKRWRRALAKRYLDTQGRIDNNRDQEKEEQQTVCLAAATGLVLGSCTAFTLADPISGSYARNFRSYWSESIVFGLLQQDVLEDFQQRLAAIGDPLKPDIEGLHRDWLSFRNVMWWSQLSTGSDVPQELVSRLRNELGTERLFIDLEGDLATYSAQHHRVAEDKQTAALANLQIYGSAIVVLSTLATLIGLLGAHGYVLAFLIAAAVAMSIAVLLYVRDQVYRS